MGVKRNTLTGIGGLIVLISTMKFTGYFEGEKNYVYLDQTGKPTWCNGVTNNTLGKKIIVGKTYFSKEECAILLKEELIKHNEPFERLTFDLSPPAHIGFLDFNYNTGAMQNKNGIYQTLKSGDVTTACNKILDYRFIKINGKPVDCSIKENKCNGIWTRRYYENQVCLNKITVDEFLQKVYKLPKGGNVK